jgi:class 3 adenylate cyclase
VDNARALPTYPQAQQQPKQDAKGNWKKVRRRAQSEADDCAILTSPARPPKLVAVYTRVLTAVHNTAGDGLLAEFPSVVNAVKCAVAIQSKMAERNAPIEPERRMQFRIGIKIGDLVYDEARIYGEGINVAARLEGIAEPGGICISSKVYEEISGRIELTYEDIGAQQLKNIARPVRVYRVCRDSNAPAATAVLALPDKPSARPVRASNVPIRVPAHFMGRDEALAEIETALNRYEGRVAITALQGLRGVGKTTLAAAYAERHRSAYRVTWWIRAQTEPGMRADLVALGGRLGWVGLDDKEDRAVEMVMERLRHEGDGILLIFDNAVDADALKPYLPRGGGRPCAGYLQCAYLARGCSAGRNPSVAQGDRCRLPHRPHWPLGRVRRRRGVVRSSWRPSARPRAGSGLLRAARRRLY